MFDNYLIRESGAVQLGQFETSAAPMGVGNGAAERLESVTRAIGELQDALYAQNTQRLLIVLQGMDGSGKDGVTAAVCRYVHPLGLRAVAFKAPTAEETRRDYLWRIHANVPANGQIGIFNRSHYEDVVAARVLGVVQGKALKERYQQIIDFEKMLSQTGTVILKFFLHISKDVQKKRLTDRLERPDKHWKFAASDLVERDRWLLNQTAYEDAIGATASSFAPWWIVPADSKMQRNLMTATIVHRALEKMAPKYPPLPEALKSLKID